MTDTPENEDDELLGPFSGSKFFDPDLVTPAYKAEALAKVRANIADNLADPELEAVFGFFLFKREGQLAARSQVAGITSQDIIGLIHYLINLLKEGEEATKALNTKH